MDDVEKIEEVAVALTTKQIRLAAQLASGCNYEQKSDPAFVGAVLLALAMNVQTLSGDGSNANKLMATWRPK